MGVGSSTPTYDVASSRQDVDREVETLSDTCRACRSVRDYEKIYPFCDRLGGDDCADEYQEYKNSGVCDSCGGSGIFGAGLFDSGGGSRGGRARGDKCTKAYYDMMGPEACPNGYYQATEGVRDDRTAVTILSVYAGISTLLLLGMTAYYFRPGRRERGVVRRADHDDDGNRMYFRQ